MKKNLFTLTIIPILMATLLIACVPYYHSNKSRNHRSEYQQRREQREGMRHF